MESQIKRKQGLRKRVEKATRRATVSTNNAKDMTKEETRSRRDGDHPSDLTFTFLPNSIIRFQRCQITGKSALGIDPEDVVGDFAN